MRKPFVVLMLLAISLVAIAPPAFADLDPGYDTGQASAGSTTGGGEISARGPGSGAGGGGAGGGGGPAAVRDCVVEGIGSAAFGGLPGYGTPAFVLDEEHQMGFQTCTRVSDGVQVSEVVWWSPPGPSAADAVAIAQSQLHLALPDIGTSPPRGGLQLVGVPVWFWAKGAKSASTTAMIPGLSATLTATAVDTRIHISGGTGSAADDNVTLACPGGGRPWQQGRDQAWAESTCSHPFVWNDTFTVDATITWELAWTATNGQNGTLPDVARTTSFTLNVKQAQAVTD